MPHRLFTAFRHTWRKRFGVLPLRDSLRPLCEWFSSPLGERLLSNEQALIEEALRDMFGYHLLQLSVVNDVDLTKTSRISHKFAFYPRPVQSPLVAAISDFNHLPLASNSVDLVLLHHVLDYSQNPHQVLREAASVLISRGHLVILGFNPWSFFGCWRWLTRFFSPAPQWRHQSLRLGRVLDWLALLDLEPVNVAQGFYTSPFAGPRAKSHLDWIERWSKKLRLPCGSFYMIVARKDNLAITPQKPRWQGYAGIRGWGVTKILGKASRGAGPQQT